MKTTVIRAIVSFLLLTTFATVIAQNKADGIHNGHEYVDLGLVVDGKPLLWAMTNIGAESPADYGLYFAWGDTLGYGQDVCDGHIFSFDNYCYSVVINEQNVTTKVLMSKYCSNANNGIVDYKTQLEPEDDAAHVHWKGSWRMPTNDELRVLLKQCDWTPTTMTNSAGDVVNGYKASSRIDPEKSIFFPTTGYRTYWSLSDANEDGGFWTSTVGQAGYDKKAYQLNINTKFCQYMTHGIDRYYGFPIRPVFVGAPSAEAVCEAPEISYYDGELHFSSPTPDARYYYTIEVSDTTSVTLKSDGPVPLSATYTISAYACAEGYHTSQTVVASLCWLDAEPTLSDPVLSNRLLPTATPVLIKRKEDSIVIEGANNLSHVEFYAPSGAYLGTETVEDGRASFDTTEPVVLVRLGGKTVKVNYSKDEYNL